MSGRHLTSAIVAPAGAAAGLYALTQVTGTRWFTLFAGAAVGLLLVALAWRPRVDGLRLCLPGWAKGAVGEDVAFWLHVHNTSERPYPPLEVRLTVRGLDPVTAHVEPVAAGGRAAVEFARPALSRGTTDVCEIDVVSTGVLGLVHSHVRAEYPHRLVVHPRRVPVRSPARSTVRSDDVGIPTNRPGPDVMGVREWRTGDPVRSVHWRSTARRGTLVVRERSDVDAGRLVVALACGSDADDWEDAVAVAAGACRAAHVDGRPLSLWVWGEGGRRTDAPVGNPLALLDWWAALAASDRPTAEAIGIAVRDLGADDVRVAVSAAATEQSWHEIRSAVARAGGTAHRLSVAS